MINLEVKEIEIKFVHFYTKGQVYTFAISGVDGISVVPEEEIIGILSITEKLRYEKIKLK